ncbi:MAG: hypothetical protein PVF13_01545 [Chromatiales bacterium]
MKSWKLLVVITGVAPLLLSGCAQLQTAHILKTDNSMVAITVNKNEDADADEYTNTIIDVKKDKRILPCTLPCGDEIKEEQIIFSEEVKVIVFEGSTCYSIWIGSDRYDFCN